MHLSCIHSWGGPGECEQIWALWAFYLRCFSLKWKGLKEQVSTKNEGYIHPQRWHFNILCQCTATGEFPPLPHVSPARPTLVSSSSRRFGSTPARRRPVRCLPYCSTSSSRRSMAAPVGPGVGPEMLLCAVAGAELGIPALWGALHRGFHQKRRSLLNPVSHFQMVSQHRKPTGEKMVKIQNISAKHADTGKKFPHP